jgi:hypothetical protein
MTNKSYFKNLFDKPKDAAYWKKMYRLANGEVKYYQKLIDKILVLAQRSKP